MQAIGDHQLAAGLARGGVHALAFGDAHGHRLLAQDVLAGFQRADRVFGVHAVRKDDVDGVDVAVVGQPVETGVIVDRLRIDPVDLGDLFGLVRMPADEGGRARQLALAEGRHHFFERQLAEADDRPAGLAGDGFRHFQLRRLAVGRRQRDGATGRAARGRRRAGACRLRRQRTSSQGADPEQGCGREAAPVRLERHAIVRIHDGFKVRRRR